MTLGSGQLTLHPNIQQSGMSLSAIFTRHAIHVSRCPRLALLLNSHWSAGKSYGSDNPKRGIIGGLKRTSLLLVDSREVRALSSLLISN